MGDKEIDFDKTVCDYYLKMEEANGHSMAITLCNEFFGLSDDEVFQIIDEAGVSR